jgi:hypothetical protein
LAACEDIIHELFLQGKSYKEIAVATGSNASAIALRVSRYRKQDPHKWPRLKKYVEPLSIKLEVYHCSDCGVIFGVEATDDLHDVTCPYCWGSENLIENGFSYIKIKELPMS